VDFTSLLLAGSLAHASRCLRLLLRAQIFLLSLFQLGNVSVEGIVTLALHFLHRVASLFLEELGERQCGLESKLPDVSQVFGFLSTLQVMHGNRGILARKFGTLLR